MASRAQLITDYRERVLGLLSELRVTSTSAYRVLAKIERLEAAGLEVHPTYSFKVFRNSKPFYLRVLVKDDASLRRLRANTVKTLTGIDDQLARMRRPTFEVPRVVEYGRSGPMTWDLELLVEGRHLPASWMYPSRLRPYLGEARKQVTAFRSIATLDLDVPEDGWARQQHQARNFTKWAREIVDFDALPLDEVAALHREFFAAPEASGLSVVHPDLNQGNVIVRERRVPVILDWDEVHLGAPGEMFGRHWILMCSEPSWQEEVVTSLGKQDSHFWLSFHAYAWIRGIDQIRHELLTFHGREFQSHDALQRVSPTHARIVDQMLKALTVLARNVGEPPPRRGQTGRRMR